MIQIISKHLKYTKTFKLHHVSIEKKIEFIFQNLIRQKYCSFQINDEALLVKPSFYHLMLDFNYSSISK